MASQPLNGDVKVYLTLRGQRSGVRQENVKALTGSLRKLELQVPGAERPSVGALTVDANTKGVSSYDRAGRPVVVGAKAIKDFKTVASMTGVAFPVQIGQDKFVENTAAGLASTAAGADLQKQARAATPAD
jgi:hypothetical protein